MLSLTKLVKEIEDQFQIWKDHSNSYRECRELVIKQLSAPWGLYPYGMVCRGITIWEERKGIKHISLTQEFMAEMTQK